MRPSRLAPLILVALVALAACTQSPVESASPSAIETASVEPTTPAPDPLSLLEALLDDPQLGFVATFEGRSSIDRTDDGSVPVTSTVSGSVEAAGDDLATTVISAGGATYDAAQLIVDGRAYLARADGPWIEDFISGPFPTVRESLVAILEATGAAEPQLDGLTITVEPGSDDCQRLMLALLLVDATLAVTDAGPCHVRLDLDPDGTMTEMAIDVTALGAVGGTPTQWSWDLTYRFETFGPPAEISPPTDPWVTFAWEFGGLQIGHPASWDVGGTELGPVLAAPQRDRVVGLNPGQWEGDLPTADQMAAYAEELLRQRCGRAPEAREPVEAGGLEGVILFCHGQMSDGLVHSLMVVGLAHPSGRSYTIEFYGLPGAEASDEAFFRTMLGTMLYAG